MQHYWKILYSYFEINQVLISNVVFDENRKFIYLHRRSKISWEGKDVHTFLRVVYAILLRIFIIK